MLPFLNIAVWELLLPEARREQLEIIIGFTEAARAKKRKASSSLKGCTLI